MITRCFAIPLLCSIVIACSTPASKPTPIQPAPIEVLSAVGSYLGPDDGYGPGVVLHEHHGAWWLAAGRHLMSIHPERRGTDLAVRLPARAPHPKGTDDRIRLPQDLVFHSGSTSNPTWHFQAEDTSRQQFTDPVATRVVRRGESVRLVRWRDFVANVAFRRSMAVLRTPTAERLREFTEGIDPELLTAMGGPEGLATTELSHILDETASRLSTDERADLERHRALLAQTSSAHPVLWPPSEDEKLLALVNKDYGLHDTLDIRDGWLAKLDLGDKNHRRSCQAGWAFPDPTGDTADERYRTRAAAPGRVSCLFYRFFSVAEASSEDCDGSIDFRPSPGHVYEHQSDFPFYVFVDADSRIVGARIVGYMYSQLFVGPGVSPGLLHEMLAATDDVCRETADAQTNHGSGGRGRP
jgi:hypothetical protein